MITDNNRNYNPGEENFTENNQSYVDQYQKEQKAEEEITAATEEENYLNNEFSNALELDEFEEDDSEEEEQEENYNGEQIEEPETFADDGYKID